jgi:2-keto-4-pentenoate hydratase
MTAAWNDPRITSGMRQQLRKRRELLQLGESPLGWKLAFGGPAAMERLHINAPLVGFLMRKAIVPSGSTVSLRGWTKPAAEPEITVHLGETLPAAADRQTAIRAIAGLGAAIEVADVDHPSADVEGTLERNIYQRHVILGEPAAAHAGGKLAGLTARVLHSGAEIVNTRDFEALTGELIDMVRHVANLLGVFGETLDAGQVIITGSITPPIWVHPDEEIVFDLAPLPAISVKFSAS